MTVTLLRPPKKPGRSRWPIVMGIRCLWLIIIYCLVNILGALAGGDLCISFDVAIDVYHGPSSCLDLNNSFQ